ncbi:hypothetical protein PHAMO_80159 [Magnetospirillum molischianum DSM 120]|uniref:Uncharacterized protein n=1 Tax=Magnetospirillum molischianum DSM 120 TaxID=1150626 RepID=H8FYD0_MAGML|nr:hypothetical protein PHAMO_80159 [Magnetospirillum molischianum DSM 120]
MPPGLISGALSASGKGEGCFPRPLGFGALLLIWARLRGLLGRERTGAKRKPRRIIGGAEVLTRCLLATNQR